MDALIEEQREAIAQLCRRFHVRRLELFGSAATEEFDPTRSDVDFLVEFAIDPPLRALDAYFGLKEGLASLLGRPVDLVVDAAVVNPYLRASIERSRITLYAG